MARTSLEIRPNSAASQNMVFSAPTFSGTWGSADNPGFGLEASEVSDIARALPGSAVTVEHNALSSILDNIDKNPQALDKKIYRSQLDQMHGDKRAVGTVIGANKSEVVLSIDPSLSGLSEIVGSGYLNGLSLTTVRDANGKIAPLEMTLTNTPARGHGAKLNFEYKDGAIRKLNSIMSDAQAAAAPTTPAATETTQPTAMEAAVASLSEEHRAAVIDRLKQYEDAMAVKDASAKQQAEQLAQLEQLTKAKEADRDLILAQFRTLQAAMAEAGASDAAKRLEGLDSMLQSENTALRDHATSQLVMACSAAFQGRSVAAAPAPAAAAAVPATPAAPAEPVAKRAKLANDAPDDLRNLLRSSF